MKSNLSPITDILQWNAYFRVICGVNKTSNKRETIENENSYVFKILAITDLRIVLFG